MVIDESIANIAGEGYDSLSYENGIVRRNADTPEWVANAIYEAHDDIMPNNWVYEVAHDAFAAIHDGVGSYSDDVLTGFADSADMYNADLLNWVRDYPAASGFIDEAVSEFGGAKDFFHSIQMGQYEARSMIFGIILEAVTSELTDREDAEDDPSEESGPTE